MTITRDTPAGADCGKDYAFDEVIARAYKKGREPRAKKRILAAGQGDPVHSGD